MTRIIVMGIIMAFAVGFVGCRACLAPYDYCQPTFIPERGDQCMGELYRCGSNLGGMNRGSNVTGDCANCGGGSVEYYTNEGVEVESAPATPATPASSATPAIPATNLGSAQYTAPSYSQNVVQNNSDFALNNDYEAY